MIFSTTVEPLSFHDLLCTGKYKGRRVLDICVEDMDYLRWMMENGSIFDAKVERCIRGIRPKPRDYRKFKKNAR